jgi:hypothetical protein
MASGLVPNTTRNFLRWLEDLVIFVGCVNYEYWLSANIVYFLVSAIRAQGSL